MLMRLSGSVTVAALLTAILYYSLNLLIDTGATPVFTEAPPRIIPTIHEYKEPEKPIHERPPVRPAKPVPPPIIDFTGPTIDRPGPPIDKPIDLPKGDDDGRPAWRERDRDAQPIFRQEPNFSNITQAEYITLQFDVRPDGSVDRNSIEILQATSSKLERPAAQAVRKWKYRSKLVNGEAVWQRGIRVAFKIAAPE
ncbi:MAG: TonB family protein [Pseudomonadota bacterium]